MSPNASRSVAFAHPVLDLLLAGGGSVLAFAFFSSAGGAALDARLAQVLVLYLVWAGNAPHFAATHYRLYRSAATMRRFPFTAFAVPLFVAALVALSLQYPDRIAPYFVKLYLWWSPYHYSGQAVGLCLLYARRSGFTVSPALRASLVVLLYGTFVTSVLRAESGAAPLAYFGIPYPVFGVPATIVPALFAGLALAAVGCAWFVVREARRQGRWPSWLCAVPILAHWVWFIPGPSATTFFQMVPFFHGIQYLLVAGCLQIHERRGTASWSTLRIGGETAAWLGFNIAGGILLMGVLPKAIAGWSGGDALVAMPIVIAGVQIHHFFVDGVIWKLRDAGLAALTGAAPPSARRAREAA